MGSFFSSIKESMLIDESPLAIKSELPDCMNNPQYRVSAELEDALNISPKHQFIKEIISKKIKKINFPDDFKGLLCEIELKSGDLLMMSIELYEKIINLVEEYQVPLLEMPRQPSRKFIKSFYVRPKFSTTVVVETIQSIMPNTASILDN